MANSWALVSDGVNDHINFTGIEFPTTGTFGWRFYGNFDDTGADFFWDVGGGSTRVILRTSNQGDGRKLDVQSKGTTYTFTPLLFGIGNLVDFTITFNRDTGDLTLDYGLGLQEVISANVNNTDSLTANRIFTNSGGTGNYLQANTRTVEYLVNGSVVNLWTNRVSGTETALIDIVGGNTGLFNNFASNPWSLYDAGQINFTDWQRKYPITQNTLVSPINDPFTSLVTEVNLPTEIFTIAEPAEWTLIVNTGQYATFPDYNISSGADFTIEVEWFNIGSQSSAESRRFLGRSQNTSSDFSLTRDGLNFEDAQGNSGGVSFPTMGFNDYHVVPPFWVTTITRTSGVIQAVSVQNETGKTHVSTTNSSVTGSFQFNQFFRHGTFGGGTLEVRSVKFNNDRHYKNTSTSTGSVWTDILGNGSTDATLVNFPTDGRQWFRHQEGGGDIRIGLSSDGTNMQPLQIRKFDNSTNKAVLHIRTPNLPVGQQLWVYYGKTGEVQPHPRDVLGSHDVWADRLAVHHLSENVNNSTDGYRDSTGNGYHGTGISMSLPSVAANFGDAQAFDGVSDLIQIPASMTNELGVNNQFVMSAWVKLNDLDGTQSVLGADRPFRRNFNLEARTSNYVAGIGSGNSLDNTASIGGAIQNQWQLLHSLWDGNELSLYVDGSLLDSIIATRTLSTIDTRETAIGSTSGQSGNELDFLNGEVHSVRFSNSVTGWNAPKIAAEFENQNTPNVFWLNGTPQDTVGGAPNTAPVSNAGPQQTVTEGTLVTLDGSGSSDADGDPLTYLWTQIFPSSPLVTLSDNTAVQPTFTAPSSSVGSFIRFSLVVNDGTTNSGASTVNVFVDAAVGNTAPVANAGVDQSNISGGALVTLDGSGSSDPDSDPLTYLWTQTLGTTVTLSSTTAVQPTFTAPSIANPETLTFELVVNDGTVNSPVDSVNIGILASASNSPPIADAGPTQNDVVAGSLVTLDASGSSDPDGDPLTFTWTQVVGTVVTLSDSNAVQPTFTAPSEVDPQTMMFRVFVNDGVEDVSSTANVFINVLADTGTPATPLVIQNLGNSQATGVPTTSFEATVVVQELNLANSLGITSITSFYDLIVGNVLSSQVIRQPNLVNENTLSVQDIRQLTTLGSSNLGVFYTLVSQGINVSQSLELTSLAAKYSINLEGLVNPQTLDVLNLDNNNNINLDRLLNNSSIESSQLLVRYILAINDLRSQASLSSPAIGAEYTVSPTEISSGNFISSPSLGEEQLLSLVGLMNTMRLNTSSASVEYLLNCVGSRQDNLITETSLQQLSNITPDEINLQQTNDQAVLSFIGSLGLSSLKSDSSLGEVSLQENSVLSSTGLRSESSLTFSSLLENNVLTPQDLETVSKLSELELFVNYIISLDEVLQASSSDNPQITMGLDLTVLDIELPQELDSVDYSVTALVIPEGLNGSHRVGIAFFGVLPEVTSYLVSFSKSGESNKQIYAKTMKIKFGE